MSALVERDGEEAILFDGLEGALVGIAQQYTGPVLAVYDYQRIIDILMTRDGLSWEDAIEHFGFNIADLWAGSGTPLIMVRVEELEPMGIMPGESELPGGPLTYEEGHHAYMTDQQDRRWGRS